MTTDEKITKWSAKYMNGTNILDRGSEYVLKNGLTVTTVQMAVRLAFQK